MPSTPEAGPEGTELAVIQEAKAMQEAFQKLGGFSPAEVIQYGHEALIRLLVAKVEAGLVTHQEMAILRNLLRDNGMVMGLLPMKTIDGQPIATQGALPELPQLDEYKP
jgi:hypothetical protein